MAFKLEIKSTNSTPYVLIDEEKGYFNIKGDCYSENVIDFFDSVTSWLDQFLATDFPVLTLDCELEYFNSSSSKLLYNMLSDMDACASGGKKIVVNWIYDSANDIIIECGEDFEEELVNLEFNMVKK